MVGWRFEDSVSSEKVEALEVAYSKYPSCEDSSSSNISLHNIGRGCFKFTNESVCLSPEDSGKGVVTKGPKDGKYYLQGIVDYYDSTRCAKIFWDNGLYSYRNFVETVGYLF